MIGTVLAILAPTLICVALGFGWARLKQSYDTRMVARLITLIGAPCLIFTTLLRTTVDLAALGEVALIALIALAIFALVALAALRAIRLPIPAYLPPLTFHNAGNLGLSICLFAFGEAGLAIAIAYFAVTATLHYTLGTWFYSGRTSPADAFKTPLPYAIAIAIPLLLLDARPPDWLLNTTGLLGQVTIPLMLFTLGVSLNRLELTKLPRHAVLAALRLALGFGVGLGLAELFGLEGIARGVVIVQASMPAAVFNYLLAQHFGRYSDEAASIALASTLLAVISLPLVLWYVL
jgi:malate permease and related proteins